jgi:predicted solute-binding protein
MQRVISVHVVVASTIEPSVGAVSTASASSATLSEVFLSVHDMPT